MRHNECSPSQVARIIACPGSRRLLRQKAKSTNEYAEEGTMLHGVVAYKILENYSNEYPIVADTSILTEEFPELTREQNTTVEECLDYFEALLRELNLTTTINQIYIEVLTDLYWADLPECGGHSDIVIESEGRLDIIDWKFGQGVFVDSIDNVQAKTYALGCFDNIETVHNTTTYTHIVQPRLDNMSAFRIPGIALASWLENVLKPAILKSREADANCIPSEFCKWCVGVTCKARADSVRQTAANVFEPYAKGKTIQDFEKLEDLAYLLEQAKVVDTFIKELGATILSRCMTNEGFPGYKAVPGRSIRGWKDPIQAEKTMNVLAENPEYGFEFEDLYTTKFITVAQAEKLCKSMKKVDIFKALWYKPQGKAVLAPDSDPRPPISLDAQNVFKDFIQE